MDSQLPLNHSRCGGKQTRANFLLFVRAKYLMLFLAFNTNCDLDCTCKFPPPFFPPPIPIWGGCSVRGFKSGRLFGSRTPNLVCIKIASGKINESIKLYERERVPETAGSKSFGKTFPENSFIVGIDFTSNVLRRRRRTLQCWRWIGLLSGLFLSLSLSRSFPGGDALFVCCRARHRKDAGNVGNIFRIIPGENGNSCYKLFPGTLIERRKKIL